MSTRRHVMRALAALALASVMAPDAEAQGGRGRRGQSVEELPANVPYDGRFTFARIRYRMSLDGFGGGRFGGEPPWLHDYPRAERNFTAILAELTTIQVRRVGSVILTLDSPELFKYPVTYMSEPGFWAPNDAEVAGMRAYLLKGGFVIFDDFAGEQFLNLLAQMRRVLPEHRPVKLTAAHPIFDSFYRIESLEYSHPYIGGMPSEFWGIFEDNDPSKRLMMIINHNNDLSEYWEFSDQGFFPVELSNEAYKLGINYVVYALSR
jgi:hypothetical protein